MPQIKRLSRLVAENVIPAKKIVNWYPGHMFAGLQAMIGKLNTVDCVIEVHDARLPFTGRNLEFRDHLGCIKPHILMLNKCDLADMSRWNEVQDRLNQQGDKNVILTNLTGADFSYATRGYDNLLKKVIELINQSDRYNRSSQTHFKIMVSGIPNVGKSTLINRLRQNYLGLKGEASRVGPEPGVTRKVENLIKICGRPPIYSLDTPGVLQPHLGKDKDVVMRLALCSNVRDSLLKPLDLGQFLLDYLNATENYVYMLKYELEKPVTNIMELVKHYNCIRLRDWEDKHSLVPSDVKKTLKQHKDQDVETVGWAFIRDFRKGKLGRVMFL